MWVVNGFLNTWISYFFDCQFVYIRNAKKIIHATFALCNGNWAVSSIDQWFPTSFILWPRPIYIFTKQDYFMERLQFIDMWHIIICRWEEIQLNRRNMLHGPQKIPCAPPSCQGPQVGNTCHGFSIIWIDMILNIWMTGSY